MCLLFGLRLENMLACHIVLAQVVEIFPMKDSDLILCHIVNTIAADGQAT